MALAALALLVSLTVLVSADAGRHSDLAWAGAGTAALALGVGVLAGSPGAVHLAVGLLGAIFVLRQDTRLLLAVPYGAGLLLMDDLAIQAVELRAVGQITADVIGARTAAACAAAAVGACASAAAAFAVTAAPGRSVAVTALGAVVAVAAFALIVRLARRRYGTPESHSRVSTIGTGTDDRHSRTTSSA